MDNLRWVLLVVGVLVVAGVYLWESARRRARRQERDELDEADREILLGLSASRGGDDPFNDLLDPRDQRLHLDADDMAALGAMVPDDEEAEEPQAREPAKSAERRSGLYAIEPKRGRTGEDLIIVMNVMAEPGEPFRGSEVRAALESVEMRFGDMQIFHHYGVGDMRTEVPVFSVANMVNPGTFDMVHLDSFVTPGLVMFMRLPGPLDSRVAFELLLNTGQRLADELHGELRDETRSVLSAQTIAHVRERITEFNRRQLLAAS
jgi:cell division protein ZipA